MKLSSSRNRKLILMVTALTCLFRPPRGIAADPTIEAEVVTLRDGGFFPSRITRPKGKFLLVIKNRSSATSITLSVVRSDAATVVPSSKIQDLNQDYLLDLPPNTYTVADSQHPQWSHLTIVLQ